VNSVGMVGPKAIVLTMGGCCEEDTKVLEAWDEENAKTVVETLG